MPRPRLCPVARRAVQAKAAPSQVQPSVGSPARTPSPTPFLPLPSPVARIRLEPPSNEEPSKQWTMGLGHPVHNHRHSASSSLAPSPPIMADLRVPPLLLMRPSPVLGVLVWGGYYASGLVIRQLAAGEMKEEGRRDPEVGQLLGRGQGPVQD